MRNAMSITATMMLLICVSMSLSAQTTATWKGGKPGRANDWNCAANWKEGRAPDDLSQVFIPAGVKYFPVINNNTVDTVDALLIEGGATLTLETDAYLVVLGETGRLDGIQLFGKIYNKGTIEIGNQGVISKTYAQHIEGNGTIMMTEKSIVKR
jgi:hypothetical protein